MVPGAKDGRETFLLTFEILLSNTRSEFSVWWHLAAGQTVDQPTFHQHSRTPHVPISARLHVCRNFNWKNSGPKECLWWCTVDISSLVSSDHHEFSPTGWQELDGWLYLLFMNRFVHIPCSTWFKRRHWSAFAYLLVLFGLTDGDNYSSCFLGRDTAEA